MLINNIRRKEKEEKEEKKEEKQKKKVTNTILPSSSLNRFLCVYFLADALWSRLITSAINYTELATTEPDWESSINPHLSLFIACRPVAVSSFKHCYL